MYVAECWPATKEVETRLSVMETKMLRWTAGVTRMDRIRNDVIRQKFGVVPIEFAHLVRYRCRADSGQDARSSLTMVRPRSAWKGRQRPQDRP
ncbi:unnamed protein product [Heligmosomoides polygyrus]|uniref:Transposase n=1 Tax=Heligmosomoides polygyrus TaxID=6339 RepID=A0A183FLM0_HELPZ|nr:unnamed protein product [Heligmosomoides polygyrus]